MKLEHKSLLVGVIIGFGSIILILFVIGNIKTEFTFSIGKQDEKVRKDQNVSPDHVILSYNIKYDNTRDVENNWSLRKKRLIHLWKDYNPSIFGIQEGLFHQVKYIDSSLEKHKYIGVGRDDGETKGEFCAIYFDTTFYEILEHSTFWLSETPDLVSVGWDAALERVCTYGLFVSIYSGERFLVCNTHFDHIGKVARKKSSELILNKIKEINKNPNVVSSAPYINIQGLISSSYADKPISLIGTDPKDEENISIIPDYMIIGDIKTRITI